MKVFVFSDTHGYHEQLSVPPCDLVICAGDISNSRNPIENLKECNTFIKWFNKLLVKHKIFIAGNHDVAFERDLINKEFLRNVYGITYLLHEECILDFHGRKINIFGSPYTPTFNNWSFNVNRSKIARYWEVIPNNLDILITHGPPKRVLDLSENKEHVLEYCGDSALFKAVLKTKPNYHVFGHIHDTREITNSGTLKYTNIDTTFINASCVTDNRFEFGLSSKGVLFSL